MSIDFFCSFGQFNIHISTTCLHATEQTKQIKADKTRKSRLSVSFECLHIFKLRKHLEAELLNICTPPTFDWLAGRTQPEPRMPAKQVIQAMNVHFLEALWCTRALFPREGRLKSNVERNVSEIILYLHSQRRALFFPLWADWRNFLTPSTEGSGDSSSCAFLEVTHESAASSTKHDKLQLCIRPRSV